VNFEGGKEWRRGFFVWEEHLFNGLLEDLEGHVWSQEEDVWWWKLEEGRFSVKSMYAKLEGMLILEDSWSEDELLVFKHIWKSPAPSKVVAFSWKLLLDRIPTRLNLRRRNALPQEVSLTCVMCIGAIESANHLFLHCPRASSVWFEVMVWIDNVFILPPNLFDHWSCWNAGVYNKKIVKGIRLIWHATIWLIWKARNDIIFNNKACEVMTIVKEIKLLSWRWSLERLKIPGCLYYEWCWNPKECLKR